MRGNQTTAEQNTFDLNPMNEIRDPCDNLISPLQFFDHIAPKSHLKHFTQHAAVTHQTYQKVTCELILLKTLTSNSCQHKHLYFHIIFIAHNNNVIFIYRNCLPSCIANKIAHL